MRPIIYDLETKESGDAVGWNKEAMGIACLVVYDIWERRYIVFDDKSQKDFNDKYYANHAICAVGYNNLLFDEHVIQSCWGLSPNWNTFDILQGIKIDLGTEVISSGGFTLDEIYTETFHCSKFTPVYGTPKPWELYAQGRYAELISYCLEDVRKTRELFYKILQDQTLNSNDYEITIYPEWFSRL